jgi:hydrogenase nickel incorporation protein HypA/HybF
MHELSIIAGLMETVEALAREHKAREVTGIRIRIGALSGVVAELLDSAFDIYKKGTIAENAVLEIEKVPFKVRCKSCGAESERDDFQFACAACGSADLEVVQGTELVLERIEMDSDEPEK